MTRQCCHGYARPHGQIHGGCEKVDLSPITETAENLGAKEFIKMAKTNGFDEEFTKNITLFAPLDDAFTDFAEHILDNVYT